ncbi:FecR family protein [Chitinophaga qingshengii]|uniref:DUF4974 domain-containing protein n=1 Tax=Chitinophaga qingshengii TaxID=1569794 RepID=A0ABR7TKJ0_9BACT|nr:FecR domain-containing protein [Chitinophaga qingshengii]MBC9930175.1 DUF4974 domain-containing protein [Chitinophaga qingshengii]
MNDHIHRLIEKYLDGSITPSEEEALMAWYQDHPPSTVEWISDNTDEEEQVRLRMLTQLNRQINAPQPRKRAWYYIPAAAALLLMFCLAGYFYFSRMHENTPPVVAQQIVPGSNKAILTLANGDQVILEEAQNGIISQQGNTAVNKTDSGHLAYNTLSGSNTSPIAYNTLQTPYGGQYQITLQDGTKVWLNAGSSLRYPTSFSGNERTVILNGEAYFEVAKDKARPFLVSVNAGAETPMTVQVLGTHFNIHAYADEQRNIVTLLEGAVKVGYGENNRVLAPGKEAILNKTSGKLQLQEGDTEAAVAWKNGYFLFNNENVADIMKQISRWYDVEISYQGDVSRKAIGGSLSRSKNVTEVLNMLELTGTVHFKIEGRRITVMP